MELTMVNGFGAVGFAELNENELMWVDGGEFLEGLVHVIEGAILTGGGMAVFNAATYMTTTKILPALLMIGTATAGAAAVLCGLIVVGCGIYEMCN